ncbi:MAG: BON domain-containing protein [Gammaproteobacteria bacterium]|nr:BON domain-containing protein [Gammaproteobacteria bacterium]
MPQFRLLLSVLVLSQLVALTGCVPAIVAGAAGTAAVATDRRTVGSMIDDENIELKASAIIGTDAELKGVSHINVISMNGIVLLTGEAATTEARDRILTHVRGVNGVRRITNEIQIASPSSLGSRGKDSLITSAVKSRLAVTKGLDAGNVKVATEAGAVYLMGLVKRSEGDLAAELATGIDGVQRVVKVFEYLD